MNNHNPSPATRPLIGLNGRFLIAKMTGVQRSALRMLQAVIKCSPDMDFILFTGESADCNWSFPNLQVVRSNLDPKNVFLNHLWEQFVLPSLAAKYKVDVLHSPANMAPIFYRGKSMVNVHDLCFMVEPSWYSLSFRLIYSLLIPWVVKKSTIVVTNSNNSKNDFLKILHAPVGKIRWAHWAVDPNFFDTKRPYEERNKRILFVGSIEPRKNLSGLLSAFNLFRGKYPKAPVKLTVVGCENPLFADQDYDLGAFVKDVEFVGYVTDEELAQLYADSLMLVYPSFYEGFGFPPLEAMATGTPVVTSHTSSLPEVVGDAAFLIDPTRPSEIAEKMERIFTDSECASGMIERGYRQASRFTWEAVGEHIRQIYQELLAMK